MCRERCIGEREIKRYEMGIPKKEIIEKSSILERERENTRTINKNLENVVVHYLICYQNKYHPSSLLLSCRRYRRVAILDQEGWIVLFYYFLR